MNNEPGFSDAINELRASRVHEIEMRMNAFLMEKQGIAESAIIRKVQAAREDVRQLKSTS